MNATRKRHAIEDAERVPEDVRRVQQELDDRHYARRFEEDIDEMTRSKEDAVFNDIVGLYAWGDMMYRQQRRMAVLSNPWHECQKGCRMRLVEAVVYRRTLLAGSGTEAAGAEGAMPARSFGDIFGASRLRTYHMCFPASCQHLFPGHACIKGGMVNGQCWHAVRDQPADTRRLDQFWVCETTGNVHVCGDLCTKRSAVSEREGDMVCQLTGQVLSRQMVMDAAFGASAHDPRLASTLMLGASAMDGGTAAEEPVKSDPEARQSVIVKQARGQMADIAKRPSMRMHFVAFVEAMCDELFFSEKRQRLEVDVYLSGLRRAYEDLTKFMRVPKMTDDVSASIANFVRMLLRARDLCGPDGPGREIHHQKRTPRLISLTRGLEIYASRAPTSDYFANVPMMDGVARDMMARLAQIEFQFMNTDARHPSDIPALRSMHTHHGPTPERVEATRRFARMHLRVVQHYRATHGLPPYTGPLHWSSPEWQDRRRRITETYSRVIVRAWENLFDSASGHTRETLVFGRVALGLLYITKTSLVVEDAHIAPAKVHVVVVPSIPFSGLLPRDNQLDRFDQSLIAPLTGARRLTIVQSLVRAAAQEISDAGRLPSVQLRLLDVVSEEDAKNCAIYAGAPPAGVHTDGDAATDETA